MAQKFFTIYNVDKNISIMLYILGELSMQPFVIENSPKNSFNDFPLVIVRSTLN